MSSESQAPRAPEDDVPGAPVVFVVSGPSGVGKSTLCAALLDADPGLVLSVSHTTRAPRGRERDAVEYFFVDDPAFDKMVEDGAFIEWAHVHDRRYGTSRAFVDAVLARGGSVLFDVDYQGARSLRAAYGNAVTVMVLPPTLEALSARLTRRGTDAPEVVARRLRRAVDELQHATEFEFLLVNDDLEAARHQIVAIYRAARLRADLVWPRVAARYASSPQ